MKCVKVLKKDAEKTKQKLIQLGVLAKGYKPKDSLSKWF